MFKEITHTSINLLKLRSILLWIYGITVTQVKYFGLSVFGFVYCSSLSAQAPTGVDPYEHIEEATENYLAESTAKLEMVKIALDLDEIPFILEATSRSAVSNNWTVNIRDTSGQIINKGIVKSIAVIELDDGLTTARQYRLESTGSINAMEDSLIVAELQVRAESTYILGEYHILELANGMIQQGIAIRSGAKSEDILISEAYAIKEARLQQSDRLDKNPTPSIPDMNLGFSTNPSVQNPLFFFTRHTIGHSTVQELTRVNQPTFILAVYDPILFIQCGQACIDATNALIVEINEEEEQVDDIVTIAEVGGFVNCQTIFALGIPGLGVGCAGVGLTLIVVELAVDAFYDGLRDAANQGCLACDHQCLELYGDAPA